MKSTAKLVSSYLDTLINSGRVSSIRHEQTFPVSANLDKGIAAPIFLDFSQDVCIDHIEIKFSLPGVFELMAIQDGPDGALIHVPMLKENVDSVSEYLHNKRLNKIGILFTSMDGNAATVSGEIVTSYFKFL